jgi:hypothetical protein
MSCDACQHSPGMGAHQYVSTVRTYNSSCAVDSTRSHNNVLRVELDSHTDTCGMGRHALLIHEHPKVVMLSCLDPSQLPQKAKVVDVAVWYTCRDSGDHLILLINRLFMCLRFSIVYYVPCNVVSMAWRSMMFQSSSWPTPLPRAILSRLLTQPMLTQPMLSTLTPSRYNLRVL